jgi:hypothetical protein
LNYLNVHLICGPGIVRWRREIELPGSLGWFVMTLKGNCLQEMKVNWTKLVSLFIYSAASVRKRFTKSFMYMEYCLEEKSFYSPTVPGSVPRTIITAETAATSCNRSKHYFL